MTSTVRSLAVAAGVALLAGSTASAGTVLINPSAAQVTGAFTGTTAASAKMRFHPSNWDMSLSPTTNTSVAGAFLSKNITNTSSTLSGAWNFNLTHTAGSGYAWTLTSVASPSVTHTLTWAVGAPTVTDTSASVLGGEQATRSFNFIRLHARASGTGQELAFSNLAFSVAGDGSLNAGTVTPTTGLRSSIDGSGGDGFNYQDILSDMDLSLINWNLTGTIDALATSTSETLRFQVDMLNRDFQLVQVVPLPPAGWAGLATLGGALGVGYVRRRRQLA